MNSIIPKINEKIKNELINFFCLKIIKRQVIMPQKIAKKAGITINAIGIKNLKLSSKVRDMITQ